MNFYKLIANGRDVLKTSSGREYLPDMRLEVLARQKNSWVDSGSGSFPSV